MTRSTLARRYAPLFLIAAVQLLIIATVPSTAARSAAQQVTAGVNGYAGGSASSGAAGTSAGQGTGAGGNVTTSAGGYSTGSGATGDTGGGAIASGGTGGGGTAGTVPPGAQTTGDTSHCVGGREFDAAIAYWSPPCTPGTPGGPFANNGGATGPGVTANQITIVDYNGDPGAEVDQIQKAEGLYESYSNAQVLDRAYETFLNKYYVLYGRQVKVITYQGQCQIVPPDTNCLIPEMDKLANQYHPFAVLWGNNTLCSACYAELARDRVVTFGGVGFSDAFANANAPYFYAFEESATRIEQAFAEFYCKQLNHSQVKFAGHENPAQNFNGQARELGVISTNDPDNEATVRNVLYPALRACGVPDVGKHEYFYAQDINTAAQQVAAGIAAMDTPTKPATTVLCLCDYVAPQFLYEGEKQNNYYPENVIATDQLMDFDKSAQAYESGLACPGGGNCDFDLAFGLAPNGPQQPQSNNEGTRMFRLGGGTALPVDPLVNEIFAQDWGMIGALLENTGPNLTAANMQARAPALGAMGGGSSGQALLQFGAGDWSWQQDARIVYWSKSTPSTWNGQPGAYITIEGTRFGLGQYPTLTEPPIPARPD